MEHRGCARADNRRDTDPLEIRRARAAGVLAGPRLALDLLAGRGREAGDPGPGAPAAQLYLHISPRMSGESVLTGGPVEVERLGVATRELIAAWLSGATVTVRPVLDLARDDTVDTHDPPSWMHEVVILRDGHCVFPECRRSARRCDLDHIRPYVAPDEGGPPGQTSPDNLAPPCRRHHRAKTHGAFDYERRPDGSYCWTLPTGRQVLAYPVR